MARLATIVIDAGHGGEDPGALGRHGSREKDVTLSIARRLKKLVEDEPNMRALLTRDGDYFLPLAVRVDKARKVKADLFVSIHADAFVRPDARGSSVFALSAGEPVGFCFVMPDDPSHAGLAPGRALRPSEKLNTLAIGVRRPARGRGVNFAMAAHGYLELVRQGWTHLSYTLVLDDNWPSRRTGEGLGASLCANYVAYRRDLRRR